MMHLSLCSISFRHHLISLPELADWAAAHGFQGIELWGAHARSLVDQPQLNAFWLNSLNLSVPMISDYLPMDTHDAEARQYCASLCKLARHWGAKKIRTFAGKCASRSITPEQYQVLVTRLRFYCDIVAEHELELLIETHPNTSADTTAATRKLLDDVDHPALKINFDVLHIWEAGDDPVSAWYELAPSIHHMHLKNISAREFLPVFEPANIYAAAGDRTGIVPTFEGAFDCAGFLTALPSDWLHYASLEWFGAHPKEILQKDCAQLFRLEQNQTHRPPVWKNAAS